MLKLRLVCAMVGIIAVILSVVGCGGGDDGNLDDDDLTEGVYGKQINRGGLIFLTLENNLSYSKGVYVENLNFFEKEMPTPSGSYLSVDGFSGSVYNAVSVDMKTWYIEKDSDVLYGDKYYEQRPEAYTYFTLFYHDDPLFGVTVREVESLHILINNWYEQYTQQ